MFYKCKAHVWPTSILRDILGLDIMVGMNISMRSRGWHRIGLEKLTDLTKTSGVLMFKSSRAVLLTLQSILLWFLLVVDWWECRSLKVVTYRMVSTLKRERCQQLHCFGNQSNIIAIQRLIWSTTISSKRKQKSSSHRWLSQVSLHIQEI